MSAQAGWYPDPGGGPGLYRYWDGRAWSAATTAHPGAPPPTPGLVPSGPAYAPGAGGPGAGRPGAGRPGAGGPGAGGYGPAGHGPTGATPGAGAYANYRQATAKKSAAGWWIGAATLLVVIIVVAVVAVRALSSGGGLLGTDPIEQPTEDVCPQKSVSSSPLPHPQDGRVHGGPVSYPKLGSPWGEPVGDDRVPFGSDVQSQLVMVEPSYQPGSNWVASVLVGELQAGDGFYTPEQGADIVVRCLLGAFYGDNPVNSDVQVDQGITIDGHDGWLVESHLTFDIEGLETKGELLIVAIVSTGARSGLFYASIPDTRPELVEPARDALRQLQVDD